jgi:hypothetical protein
VAAAACAWCWYGQPLLRRRALHQRADAEAPQPLRPHAVHRLHGDASRR